jgi:hypothetical protein
MGSPRQKCSLVNDPLGLLALPDDAHWWCSTRHGPQPGINGTESSSGATIAANTIGGVLVVMLIAVSLIAPPGPPKAAQSVAICEYYLNSDL